MVVIRRILIAEGLLRLSALLLASLTACLVGFDTQTKKVFFSERKATVKDLSIMWVLTIVASVTAGYNLIQLCKCLVSVWLAKDLRGFKKWGLWVCLMLDQGVMYAFFATTLAATQAALVAAIGVDRLQWTKLCNIYTRFCTQIGGGLLCAVMACIAMALLSPISAYNLFRLFSSSKLPH